MPTDRDKSILHETDVREVIQDEIDKTVGATGEALTINQQADDYTLVLTDAGNMVEMSKATASTLTIPANADVAFDVGAEVLLLATGAGQVTVAGANGVTVNGAPGLKLTGQWSGSSLIKRATNTWVVIGDLTA